MMAREPIKRRRNRADAEQRLGDAVERLLIDGGFGAVTPSAVGRAAGLDKMLIYRYFGDLAGLMRAVVARPGFFPSFEDICAGNAAGVTRLPLVERSRLVLARYVDGLRRSPVALELMAWEMVERNDLTAIAETARETLGLRIARELFADQDPEAAAATSALLGSAVTYLLLRGRKIRTFDGLDLRSSETWERLLDAAAAMAAGALAG